MSGGACFWEPRDGQTGVACRRWAWREAWYLSGVGARLLVCDLVEPKHWVRLFDVECENCIAKIEDMVK